MNNNNNNNNNNSNSNNNNNNNKAFSLIELSIVLIIIGLLVAGITGGKSLIESARIRNVINEFNNLEKSIYAFKVIKDRLPGDVNKDGILDSVSYRIYPDNTFKFPYNGTDKTNNHYSPDVYSVPFVEMYLEKVYDFEVKGEPKGGADGRNTAKSGGMPFSKAFDGIFFAIRVVSSMPRYHFLDNTNQFDASIYIQSFNDEYAIMANIAKKIDLKIDDGVYNTGKLRGYCREKDAGKGKEGSVDYDETFNNRDNSKKGGRCTQLMYIL